MKQQNGVLDMSKCLLGVVLLLSAAGAGAQSDTDSLAAAKGTDHAQLASIPVPELELRGTTPVMFATLVREAGFSGGVAISNHQCSHGLQSSVSVPAGTRFDIALGQIIGSKTTFEWKVRDSVVNLLPAGSILPLLQVKIRRFEWDRATPVREVIDRLRQMPEVSEGASKLGLEEAPIEGGASALCIRGDCSEKPKPTTVLEAEEGATLLTILNRVVHAHNRAIWSYSEYHCDKGTLFSLEVLAE